MKKTLLLIIALIALATTSCTPVTYDTFGGISGEVVDLDTSDPVQQATVTLSPTGMNTYTGDDGTFEFVDLDERQYTVTVQKTGYITNRKTVTMIAGRVIPIKLTMQKKN
jgi:hypothetical protein